MIPTASLLMDGLKAMLHAALTEAKAVRVSERGIWSGTGMESEAAGWSLVVINPWSHHQKLLRARVWGVSRTTSLSTSRR